MSFNENLRRQLNRWVHKRGYLAVDLSQKKAKIIGRHAIMQEITVENDALKFGKNRVITADQCPKSYRGRKLRNLILNYNTSKQAVIVFQDSTTTAEMTVMLNRDNMVSRIG